MRGLCIIFWHSPDFHTRQREAHKACPALATVWIGQDHVGLCHAVPLKEPLPWVKHIKYETQHEIHSCNTIKKAEAKFTGLVPSELNEKCREEVLFQSCACHVSRQHLDSTRTSQKAIMWGNAIWLRPSGSPKEAAFGDGHKVAGT